jgi:hypothetical protein
MPSETWFCVQHDTNSNYVFNVTKNPITVIWTSDENEAAWSADSQKVSQLIANNNIQNASVVAKTGGNHPPRPPLP